MKTFKAIFKRIPSEIMNAIRRTIIARVSTASFDPKNINIIENTTDLDNDQIKHRISMIPVEHADTTISVHATGATKIFSETLDSTGWIHPHLYLFSILDNQSLHFTATSSIGQGVQHARWCNTTNVQYIRFFTLKYNETMLLPTLLLDYRPEFDVIAERLPSLFNKDKQLICEKLFTDTNIIDNINEILSTETILMTETDDYQFSFEVLNNINPYELYNDALNYLIKTIQEPVITDQSIANLLVLYSNNILNIYKEHPTSDEFTVKTSDTNYTCDVSYVISDLIKLKYYPNNNGFGTEKIENLGEQC